ncbi:MAG: hypothetical protein WEB00_11380 [Dehalococcoidia bacterium]
MSLQNIVGRIFITAEDFERSTRREIEVDAVIAFKAVEATGTWRLDLLWSGPSGVGLMNASQEVTFGVGHVGSVSVIPLTLPLESFGVHWLEVRLDGRFYTRLPLAVDPKVEQTTEQQARKHIATALS